MLHNIKKILREQIMRIRLHNFCPNFGLPQKGIFYEKLTNMTDLISIMSDHAKMFKKTSMTDHEI